MLVTDGAAIREQRGADRIAAAIRGGVGIVQLRDHGASAGELLARAQTLRRLFPETLLLVNDRVDVALAAGADGVQLGAGALPVAAARRLLGAAALVGRSVHAAAEARVAAAEGADFLILGTIYPTATHPGGAPEGPALLKTVAAGLPLPLYAIGGITAANAAGCLRHGAHGVAVIRAISAAPDAEAAARQLRAAIDRARPG